MATGHLIPELKCKYFTPQAKLKKTEPHCGHSWSREKIICTSPYSWYNLFISACCWALQPDTLKVKSRLFFFSLHLRALAFVSPDFTSWVKGMSRQQKFQFALSETLRICFHCRENSHWFQREEGGQLCAFHFWKSELPDAHLRLAIDRYQFR